MDPQQQMTRPEDSSIQTFTKKNLASSILAVPLIGAAGLALGLINFLTTAPGAPAHSLGLLLAISIPSLVFLVAGTYGSWRVLHEKVEVLPDRLRHVDGRMIDEIAWKDVQSFTYLRKAGGRGPWTYYYEIKSPNQTLQLDTNLGEWSKLRDLVLSHIPAEAQVSLSEPDQHALAQKT